MSVRIAVDTMGGDLGPREIISGVMQYLSNHASDDTEIVLVGRQDELASLLADLKPQSSRIMIQNATDVITMDSPPTDGIRKKDSSLVISHGLLKRGEVAAVISTGNTGAVMASAIFNLGRLDGVSRPAIATLFPTASDKPCLVLDVGANSDCKVHNLIEFAHMGSIYYSYMYDNKSPRLALLSIGEERTKGNDVTIETHRQLTDNSLNFVGNIEGRDVLKGQADVVVCDGFVGNIILKFAESIKSFIFDKFKAQVSANVFSRAGAALMAPFLRRLKKTFDYAEYGGAPLLGINGVTIICHGASNARAVSNAIKMAREMVIRRVNEHIGKELAGMKKAVRLKGNGSE
ncbi:MAG: phosphate acyltransferase PlsX [Candidatus Zixiibacteriota bacterium]